MNDSTASSSPFGFDVETVTGDPAVAPSSFVGIGKLAAAMIGPLDNGGGDGPFTHTYTPSWPIEEEVEVEAFQRLPGKTVSLTITAQADSHSHLDEKWLEWELDVPVAAAPVPLPMFTRDDANPGGS